MTWVDSFLEIGVDRVGPIVLWIGAAGSSVHSGGKLTVVRLSVGGLGDRAKRPTAALSSWRLARVNLESRHLDSFFKPDYNPELRLTHNYITHLLVARRELYLRSGGFSPEYEGAQDFDRGAQDFDLVLKLTEQAQRIVHIPKMLYHWRASATSTSVNHTQKTYADASGRKALEAALARRKIKATVEQGQWRFYYRVRRALADTPSVSLLVRLAEKETTDQWYGRIADFLAHEPLDIHCLVPGGSPDCAIPGRNRFRHPVHCQAVSSRDTPAALYNSIVRGCSGRYLLFVAPGFVPDQEGCSFISIPPTC